MGGSNTKESTTDQPVPRAMIHERILNAAEEDPDASLEALAAEVPSATADLVERVLEKYGDPAEDDSDTSPKSEKSNESIHPPLDALTKKQRETVRAINANPDASQRELAEILGVAGPTICNRMKGIEGFDWEDRQKFAETVLDREASTEQSDPEKMTSNNGDQQTSLDQLTNRVKSIEKQVEEASIQKKPEIDLTDTELVHKIVHACLESESISKEEELEILREILQ